MSSPETPAPTRFCVQGWGGVLVGAGAGIKLGPKASPSRVTDSDVGRAEDRKSVLAEVPDTIAMA